MRSSRTSPRSNAPNCGKTLFIFSTSIPSGRSGGTRWRTISKPRGISTGIHYPTALPFMPAYEHLGYRPADFPAAYECQGEILSLPMYPELTDEMIGHVVRSIKEFYAK